MVIAVSYRQESFKEEAVFSCPLVQDYLFSGPLVQDYLFQWLPTVGLPI